MRKGARLKGSLDFNCVEIREATYQKSEEIFDDFEVEVGQTSKRAFYFQDIKSDRSNFKFDSLMNWKPVKFYKGGSDMVRSFKRRKNYSGKGILNSLQTLNGGIR